jgi:hypothetical protein
MIKMIHKKFLLLSVLSIVQSNFAMDVAPEPKLVPEDNEDLMVIQKEEDVGLFAELYVAKSEPISIHMVGHPDRYPNVAEEGDFTSYGKIKWDTDYKPGKMPPYETKLFYFPLAVSLGAGDRRRYDQSADRPHSIKLPKTVRLLRLDEVRALDALFKQGYSNYEWHGHNLSLKDLMPSERRFYRKDMREKLAPTLALLAAAANNPASWLYTLPERPHRLIEDYLVDTECWQELLPERKRAGSHAGASDVSECNVQ